MIPTQHAARIARFVLLATLCWSTWSTAKAQIILDQNFDSGALDVGGSVVEGASIRLKPRYTWTAPAFQDNYRWVYFRASGVQGLRPEFAIEANTFLGSLDGHKYVYSYDQQNWQFFDQAVENGSDYEFENLTPFTEDTVYVAYGLPYPVQQSTSWTQSLVGNPFVSSTASGNANFVIGQSAGGIDDSGRIVPPQDLHAFRVTDPTAVGPKQKILLAGGAHSAETNGQHALQGMVDFLLGDSLLASQLRSRTEFFVYPQVNPDGRFGGYYRSNPENPDKDFNRFYDNPAGFTDLSIVTAAMQADTASDVDYLFDFHSWWGPWSDDNFIFTLSQLTDSPFLQSLANFEPSIGVRASSGAPGMLRIWGMSNQGLNAEFAYTPEIGFQPDADLARLALYGENFARALRDVVGAAVACDLDANGLCDVDDIDLLTAQGDLLNGTKVSDAKYDLVPDGVIDGQDLATWLAVAASQNGLGNPYLVGDANLDGSVDAADFIAWNNNKFQASQVWSGGDFDGNGVTDAADFILWNSNKFQSSVRLVPEPTGLAFALAGPFMLFSKRRRQPK